MAHIPTPSASGDLRLTEDDARRVLLVRALEEADPEGVALPPAERRRAGGRARERLSEPALGPFAAERARELAPAVAAVVPLARAGRASAFVAPAAWIGAAALALGAASSLIGPEKRVNVLANPLAALAGWNLAVYALLGVRAMLARARPRGDAAPAQGALARALAGLALRGPGASARRSAGARSEAAAVGPQAAARFAALWGRVAGTLVLARARCALHHAAAAAALGAIAGLYARGMLLAYRATWESTFLSAGAVQAVLDVVLAPAALVTGIAVPEAARIEAPASEGAARWIHLWAATAALVVVVPRAVLAAREGARARRLARAVDVGPEDVYLRRLAALLRGGGAAHEVVPCAYRLEPRRADALRALLLDALGAEARVLVRDPLAYGAELGPPPDGVPRALLFNLAQTPEAEVHARLAEELGPSGVVLVDAAAWRERTGGAADARVGERRRAWERALGGRGARVVHVDLDVPASAELADRIRRLLEGDAPA